MIAVRIPLTAAALALGVTTALAAQTPAQPAPAQPATAAAPAPAPYPAPAVGAMAPDFTAPYADSTGAGAQPLALSSLRGKVVVLAFYPKDRSSGCTAELTKFRDEYTSLFGPDVVVLPISVDDVQSHAGWAKDMHFPYALVSDAGGQIAQKYGSITPGRSWTNRTVFVIGKDGRIRYTELKFGALDQHAYDALAQAVRDARSAS